MSNATTSPCRDFPLQMWLLLSNELSAAEQKFWQAHLRSCSRCGEVFANAQSVQEQYASLPLAGAPERMLQKVIRRAQSQRRFAWWESFAPRLAPFFDFKLRLAFAGVAFTVLVLGFHYLAFQKPIQPAWEAAAFDAQAAALAGALMEYDPLESTGTTHTEQMAQLSWDEQATGLRASIAALERELENSKL